MHLNFAMPEQPLQNAEEQAPTVNVETSRRTAHEILEEASENGRKELERTTKALVFSGVAGGITMGLTGMSVAIALATLGESPFRTFVAYLLYPIGFIAVIIGRAQLFTENTLYPVVLVLSERKYIVQTLRLWAIVLASNVFGAALFAGLAVRTGALHPEFAHQLTILGVESSEGTMATIFWSGLIGGWLIALVAWMVSASHWTIGQIAVVWLLTFAVGLGHFAHCIAASGEILAAVFAGSIAFRNYLHWFLPALGGNIVGGVFIVSLLNWGQVKAGEGEG
jgi:formate-nitrite transporter family protein